MSSYKITNKSDSPVVIPGPGGVILKAKESLKFKASSFSLTMAKSNRVLDVEQIAAGKSDDLVVESVKKAGKNKKVKRVAQPIGKPAERPEDSKKVNEDG